MIFYIIFFFELEINTNRLTIEELKQKLKDYDIDTDISNDKTVLAEILQSILNDEISKQNTGKLFLTIKL
jgi:hypothetical protein